MGLIKKFNELQTPNTVKMMVYGVAGSGKTTLALSTPSPLLLDFDNGVHRVNIEHLKDVDTVQVTTWGEVKHLLGMLPNQPAEDLSDYKTIVVDTIGKMMDYIISYVCGAKQPSIRDWGAINSEFQNFTRTLSSLGKHIVFVAHRDTRKEGDDTIYIPALREKNYSTIITDLDLLGYVEMMTENGVTRRSITFDPTPRNDGKNTCNLPSVMTIGELITKDGKVLENTWITDNVITPYMDMLSKKANAVEAYSELLDQIEKDIKAITTPEQATEYIGKVNSYEHVGSSMVKLRQLFSKKVKDMGLIYDDDAKAYKLPKQEDTEETEESDKGMIKSAPSNNHAHTPTQPSLL